MRLAQDFYLDEVTSKRLRSVIRRPDELKGILRGMDNRDLITTEAVEKALVDQGFKKREGFDFDKLKPRLEVGMHHGVRTSIELLMIEAIRAGVADGQDKTADKLWDDAKKSDDFYRAIAENNLLPIFVKTAISAEDYNLA